jgi:hypothetical protein
MAMARLLIPHPAFEALVIVVLTLFVYALVAWGAILRATDGQDEAAAIRDAVSDAVRLVNDLSDALRAVAVASRMGVEALEQVEDDLLQINWLSD